MHERSSPGTPAETDAPSPLLFYFPRVILTRRTFPDCDNKFALERRVPKVLPVARLVTQSVSMRKLSLAVPPGV